MITMHPISSGADAARYHDSALRNDGTKTPGADNYYVDDKANAVWAGKGAILLGLNGQEVQKQQFIDLLDGKVTNPVTGEIEDLSAATGKTRRAGFDMTMSAPKSVSIIGVALNDERVKEVHSQAVAKAMGWVEENGALLRAGGERHLSGNLIYANVQHETSRLNEPQLHEHNVVVAITFDAEDGKWRSLTNDEIMLIRSKADVIYKKELAAGLEKIGYQVEWADNGRDFEVKGITREQIEFMSGRSSQIDAQLIANGLDPKTATWIERQIANLDTRSSKQNISEDQFQSVVSRALDAAGIDRLIVQTSKDRAQAGFTPNEKQIGSAALQSVLQAAEHFGEREQVFKKADFEEKALRLSTGSSATIDHIKAATHTLIENKGLVAAEPDKSGAAFYTTPQAIEREKILGSFIEQQKGQGHSMLGTAQSNGKNGADRFDSLLVEFEAIKSFEIPNYKLSAEQVRAARNIMMHQDQVQMIQGDAGTGKTASLEFVKFAADRSDWNVVGMASSASASQELEGGSGISSVTIAGYVNHINQRKDALTKDIQTMRAAIGDKSQWRGVDKISMASVHAKSSDLAVDFGKHTYLVDRSTGDVMKMTGGLRGAVADFAAKMAGKLDSGHEPVTLADRFRKGLANSLEGGAAKIAHAEKVGAVQAEAVLMGIYKNNRKGGKPDHDIQVLARLRGAEARLSNIERTGSEDGKRTLFIIDEIGQTSLKDLLMVLKTAMKDGQNRLLVQGDSKQLASVGAGDTIKIMTDAGVHVSKLKEARRFVNAELDQKLAVVRANEGNIVGALRALDGRAVLLSSEKTNEHASKENSSKEEAKREFAAAVAKVYLETVQTLRRDGSGAKNTVNPSVGVTTFTNSDRLMINGAVHDLLQSTGEIGGTNFEKSHLDIPRITDVEKRNVRDLAENKVDRLVMHKSIVELGITAGSVLRVSSLKTEANRIEVINEQGAKVQINPEKNTSFTPAVAQKLDFALGDKVEARAVLSVKDSTGKLVKISNASKGKITAINDHKVTVKWGQGKQAVTLEMQNKDFQMVGHGYARTAHKGQGETNDVQIVAAGDKGVAFAASARSLYVAITRARLHTTVVATEAGRAAMDDAALKEGGKSLATDVAKEAKAAVMSEKRKDGIEISGAASPSLKEQPKTLEPHKEQKSEFVLGI